MRKGRNSPGYAPPSGTVFLVPPNPRVGRGAHPLPCSLALHGATSVQALRSLWRHGAGPSPVDQRAAKTLIATVLHYKLASRRFGISTGALTQAPLENVRFVNAGRRAASTLGFGAQLSLPLGLPTSLMASTAQS
eukprot:5470736-Heterocapsa_arctica.AAC.1